MSEQAVRVARAQGQQWLTPRCVEIIETHEKFLARMHASTNPKNSTKTRCGNLTMQVNTPKQWPEGSNVNGVTGGPLNPMWVEWLMGWPLGWTDLKPLEMDKFRAWLRSHGRY
jgi:hypothetical protein